MNKQTALEIASRCQWMSQSIQDMESESVKKLFGPAFGKSNATISRYITEKNKIWKPKMINALGTLAEMKCSKSGVYKSDVVAHLLDGNLRQNWAVVDLTVADVARQDRQTLKIEDEIRIGKYLGGDPRRILSVQRRLPFRLMTPDYIDAFYMHEQLRHGFDDAVKEAKTKIAETCVDEFSDRFDPGKTDMVVGLLSSGLFEVETCSGHAQFFSPDGRIDLGMSLRSDVIKMRSVDMRVIPDRPDQLSEDEWNWISYLELAVAVDDMFLMKVLRGGAVRIFYERGQSREKDRQLDEQLILLKRVLGVWDEEDSRHEMNKWLDKLTIGEEANLQQQRALHYWQDAWHKLDLKPPSADKSTFKIRLPNGRWIELPNES
jgi:hypothetical protein